MQRAVPLPSHNTATHDWLRKWNVAWIETKKFTWVVGRRWPCEKFERQAVELVSPVLDETRAVML